MEIIRELRIALCILIAAPWAFFLHDSCIEGNDAGLPRSSLPGLNLPPTQGTSGTGAFMPGVYQYDYTDADLASVKASGFSSLRLPVNIATAGNDESVAKLKTYIDAMDGRAILCMFGTQESGDGHGTGRVDDVFATAAAWKQLHAAFVNYPEVKYELFNEPFGYSNATTYYTDMLLLIEQAALPEDKCIIAGTSYSANVREIVDLGWRGDLAYHFYPSWVPDGSRTLQTFYDRIVRDLYGLSSRVWITEFGGNLALDNVDYNAPVDSGNGAVSDINCLQAFQQAILLFKSRGQPIKGAFHWHGWHNGDSYDFWDAKNKNGAAKVRAIMSDLTNKTIPPLGSSDNLYEASMVLWNRLSRPLSWPSILVGESRQELVIT